MKQLVHGACAATTGAGETGEQSKRTKWKEASLTWFKQKDVDRAGKQNTPDAQYGQTTVPETNCHECKANTRGGTRRVERLTLEPALLTLDIGSHKLFI